VSCSASSKASLKNQDACSSWLQPRGVPAQRAPTLLPACVLLGVLTSALLHGLPYSSSAFVPGRMEAEDSAGCCMRRSLTCLTGLVTGLLPMQIPVHGADEQAERVPKPQQLDKFLQAKEVSTRRAEVEMSRSQTLLDQEKKLQKREKAILGGDDLEGEMRLEDQEQNLKAKESDEERRLLDEEKKLGATRALLLAEEEKLIRKSRELADEEDKLEAVLRKLRADEEELAEGELRLQADEQRIRLKRRDRGLRFSSLYEVAKKLQEQTGAASTETPKISTRS